MARTRMRKGMPSGVTIVTPLRRRFLPSGRCACCEATSLLDPMPA
jgi:hypothetical protein